MSLNLLLKKHFKLILLGLVALAARFQAAGVTQLIGMAIPVAPNPAIFDGRSRIPPTTEAKRIRSADALLARNPFDSVTGPINPDKNPLNWPAATSILHGSDPLTAPTCENITAFIVTESADPFWSIAALRGPGESIPQQRRIGDTVAGRQVLYVGFNPREQIPAVWLEGSTGLCQVLMFSRVPATETIPAVAPTKPSRDVTNTLGVASVSPEIAARIQKVKSNEFHIERSAVDTLLSDPKALMSAGRMIPEVGHGGRLLGFKLSGIRQDTLLGALGLKNGDRLETLNGFELTSAEKALEAYARLRTADGLMLQLTRHGKTETIEYKIQ